MTSTPIATSTIVSQAFRFMERDPISSLGDDSPEAAATAEQYPVALQECLEEADWSFASTRRVLSAATADPFPDDALPYLYELSGDIVRLREVGDGLIGWRVDRDGLRAETGPTLVVRYTGAIEVEATLPAQFRTAVALRLAWLLGQSLTVTSTKLQEIDAQWRDQIKRCARADAGQASHHRYDDLTATGDWVSEART